MNFFAIANSFLDFGEFYLKDKMGFRWAITQKFDPARVIGSCGYFSVRRGTATVEAGYEIHPDFWRQGFMTEALQAMIHRRSE